MKDIYTIRLQNSNFFFSFRKVQSAVSVNLTCEARVKHASLARPILFRSNTDGVARV